MSVDTLKARLRQECPYPKEDPRRVAWLHGYNSAAWDFGIWRDGVVICGVETRHTHLNEAIRLLMDESKEASDGLNKTE